MPENRLEFRIDFGGLLEGRLGAFAPIEFIPLAGVLRELSADGDVRISLSIIVPNSRREQIEKLCSDLGLPFRIVSGRGNG